MWNEEEKVFCIAAYLRTSDLVETRKLYKCHKVGKTFILNYLFVEVEKRCTIVTEIMGAFTVDL